VPLAAQPAAGPELADIGRLARRLLRQLVNAARAEESAPRHVLVGHLGPDAATLPVTRALWNAYDHVNVQAGLDAWLAEPGRQHEIVGLTGFQHESFSLADLMQPSAWLSIGIGGITTAARATGPGGASRLCVQCAVYLVTDADGPLVLLLQGPETESPLEGFTVEVSCHDAERGRRVTEQIRRLSVQQNVFRGQVIEFGGEVFGRADAPMSFLSRPAIRRDQVILPSEVLDGIEEQVVGIARHAGRLWASGQHLKRGILLHGPPGTGKTHTIRYLLGQLPDVTVVLVSGQALDRIGDACSVARTLQPAMVVVEDVDLIAEERDLGGGIGQHPLLFQLLNEMDGLGPDLDVTFLLTTNRPDLLEPALAQRPGRVDHAVQLPLPDAAARLRLLRLYQGRLDLDLAGADEVIARTEGVTASFLKELLRRAALRAATQDAAAGDGRAGDGRAGDGMPLRVTAAHLAAALDQLLDTRSQLTRVLLGGHPGDPDMGED
jgi:hypothetical protein